MPVTMTDDDLAELLGLTMAMTMHKAKGDEQAASCAGLAFVKKMEALGYNMASGMAVFNRAATLAIKTIPTGGMHAESTN